MSYKLHHIHILCEDLIGMRDFFVDTLEAKLIEMKQFGGADGASLNLSGVTVNLRVGQEGEKIAEDLDGKGYGYHHVGLEVEDLDAAYQKLTDKGYVFSVPPKDLPGLRIAFFDGPENVTFELLQTMS